MLHEAADIYKVGAAKLYEKAVAERQTLKEQDLFPNLTSAICMWTSPTS